MGKRKQRSWPDVPAPVGATLVDNHTHLPTCPDEIPRANGIALPLEDQLARSRSAGVGAIITCGCELPDLAATVELTRHEHVWAALAIHPNEAALHAGVAEPSPDGLVPERRSHHEVGLDEAIASVGELAASQERVVAVGETGLDYFRTSEAGRRAQQEAFRAHIRLAKELDMPLQIHDRDAHADTISILVSDGAPERTVFHCFSGDAEMARVLAEHGWYASFAGPLTFRANEGLREAAREMPAGLVMVETDAPYLTPHPHRGCPNASYLVGLTVRVLAECRGEDVVAMAEATTATACEVYGISLA